MMLTAGQLEAAAEQLARARAIWQANDLASGPDALNTLNNLAAAEFLLGRPERAAPVFAEAVSLREALYGPSAALAAALGNYGKTLIAIQDYAAAIPVLERARTMAQDYAGAGSLHFAASASSLMEALVAAGRLDEARREMEQDAALMATAEETGPVPQAAFDVGAARVLAEAGFRDAADARLNAAETVFAGLGPGGARYVTAINTVRQAYGLNAQAASARGATTPEP